MHIETQEIENFAKINLAHHVSELMLHMFFIPYILLLHSNYVPIKILIFLSKILETWNFNIMYSLAYIIICFIPLRGRSIVV